MKEFLASLKKLYDRVMGYETYLIYKFDRYTGQKMFVSSWRVTHPLEFDKMRKYCKSLGYVCELEA